MCSYANCKKSSPFIEEKHTGQYEGIHAYIECTYWMQKDMHSMQQENAYDNKMREDGYLNWLNVRFSFDVSQCAGFEQTRDCWIGKRRIKMKNFHCVTSEFLQI